MLTLAFFSWHEGLRRPETASLARTAPAPNRAPSPGTMARPAATPAPLVAAPEPAQTGLESEPDPGNAVDDAEVGRRDRREGRDGRGSRPR